MSNKKKKPKTKTAKVHTTLPPDSMRPGILFISAYKWILALLAAFMFEKMADGICYRLTGETLFTSLKLTLPPFGWSFQNLNWRSIEWAYITGIFQFISSLLLLGRYFSTVIHPIRDGVGKDEDLGVEQWRIRVSNASWGTFVKLCVFMMVEFIFFYHAATSISQIDQWLIFLLFMVLADVVFFLRKSLIKLIAGIAKFIALLIAYALCLIIIAPPEVLSQVIATAIPSFPKMNFIERLIEKIKEQFKDYVVKSRKALGEQWHAFAPWDLWDFISIVLVLFIYHFFKDSMDTVLLELFTSATFMLLTLVISYYNFNINKILYINNIKIISLKVQI